jgi:hypothetical protein
LDPGSRTSIPVQNTECKPVVPSSSDWTTEPAVLDLLDLILQETILNGNKKKKIQHALPSPTKRTRITDWSPPTLVDIKALLGVVINMSPHPMSDITDRFSQAWVNKMSFFSDVFPRVKFLLLFWNLYFTHADGQGKLKKEYLIKSELEKIR